MITWYKNQIDPKDKKIYPCEDCRVLRSENEGGRIFTVCDDCWDKRAKETKEYNQKRLEPFISCDGTPIIRIY